MFVLEKFKFFRLIFDILGFGRIVVLDCGKVLSGVIIFFVVLSFVVIDICKIDFFYRFF